MKIHSKPMPKSFKGINSRVTLRVRRKGVSGGLRQTIIAARNRARKLREGKTTPGDVRDLF